MANIGEHHQAINNLREVSSNLTENIRSINGMSGPLGIARTLLTQLSVEMPADSRNPDTMTINRLVVIRRNLGAIPLSNLLQESTRQRQAFIGLRGGPDIPTNVSDERYRKTHRGMYLRDEALGDSIESLQAARTPLGDDATMPNRDDCRASIAELDATESNLTDAANASIDATEGLGMFLPRR